MSTDSASRFDAIHTAPVALATTAVARCASAVDLRSGWLNASYTCSVASIFRSTVCKMPPLR